MSEHELWNELGNLYFMSGAYHQAVHAYERSIQSDTTFGRPYSNLALTYVQQGKYEEAIDLYRRSIELLAEDKERAISLNRLGSVYRHLKDYSRAVIAFQEADLLDPHSVDEFPAASEVHQQVAEAPSSVLDEPVCEPACSEIVEDPALPDVEPVPTPDQIEALADEPLHDVIFEQQALIVTEATAAVEEIEATADEPLPDVIFEEQPLIITEAVAAIEEIEATVQEPLRDVIVAEPALMMPEAVATLDEIEAALDEPLPDAAVEEPALMITDAVATFDELEASAHEPEPIIEWEFSPVGNEPARGESEDDEPDVEWWDVDEGRMLSAMGAQPVASLAADDANASWTPADPTQFQQDLSQMPETGSLTTWGESDFEDDFEFFPAVGADPDQDVPDPDADRIATWIPLPEEAPLNLDEVWVPPFVEEEEPEPDLPLEWNEAPAYHVINSVDFGPAVPAAPSVADAVEYLQRSEALPARPGTAQQAWNRVELDVDVEDRPASDFALGTQQSPKPVEPQPVPEILEQAPLAVPSLNAEPPSLPDCEREEDEMREIEMGIAKFRRVVQVNPRNGHAWDALGTLYKAAGLYKDAILAYQQAISNDSSKSLYYHHLGLVYACEGRDEDAIGAFQRVLEIDPEYSLAHATLGGYYRKMGLEELAQKHIGKAMKNIFDSENEYNRACLEAICGNADHAIELLGVALKNKQTYVDWILRDPDLDFIRQDPRFKQLISDYTR